jgi:hypothetical protein
MTSTGANYMEGEWQMKKIVLAVFGFLIFASTEGYAATYWVTPGGNASGCVSSEGDPGPGNSHSSINAGVSCLASGDTLVVKAGIYTESVFGIPSGQGSSWADAVPTTVQANPGDRVVIQPSAGDPYNPIFIEDGKRFINIDGFVLDASNVPWSAFQIGYGGFQAEFIRIQNSELTNGSNGILALTNFSEFINNRIHGNGDEDFFEHGVYLVGNNNIVEQNEIYNNAASGITSGIECGTFSFTNNNNIIRHNTVRNNGRFGGSIPGMYLIGDCGQTSGTYQIYGNNVFDEPSGGIAVYGTSGTEIYQNHVSNTRTGRDFGGIYVDANNSNITIANNTLLNNENDLNVDSSSSNIFGNICSDSSCLIQTR